MKYNVLKIRAVAHWYEYIVGPLQSKKREVNNICYKLDQRLFFGPSLFHHVNKNAVAVHCS